MSEFPRFTHEQLDLNLLAGFYCRLQMVLVEPSERFQKPRYSEQNFSVEGEPGLFCAAASAADVIEILPKACKVLGLEETDAIVLTVSVPDDPAKSSYASLGRCPENHGETRHSLIEWIVNGPEDNFRSRVTGEAIELAGEDADTPVRTEELEAINEITKALFPDAPL